MLWPYVGDYTYIVAAGGAAVPLTVEKNVCIGNVG